MEKSYPRVRVIRTGLLSPFEELPWKILICPSPTAICKVDLYARTFDDARIRAIELIERNGF